MTTNQSATPKSVVVGWVIDGILAISLLSAVYQGGQFIERLNQVVVNLESLSTRVELLEQRPHPLSTAESRISVLEESDRHQDEAIATIKEDIMRRLNRMEDKLDEMMSKNNGGWGGVE